MWENVRTAWRDNHGTWLLVTAVAAFLLIGWLWRMDLLPDFQITPPANQPLLSQTIPPQNGILVAQILTPTEWAGTSGFILLFASEYDLQQQPTFQQSFQLDDSGIATVLMVMPPGTYNTVAFLDLNENGRLDFDGHTPIEPIEFPRTKRATDEEMDSADMAPVNLTAQQPVLFSFKFDL